MSSQLHPLASIDEELAERLEKDERFRSRYLRRWAQNEVATGIRSMRKRRDMLQVDVATAAGTGQSAISRIEKADYDAWTFKTLMGIAEALRARLRVTFEPIEDVIGNYRSSGDITPEVESEAGSTQRSALVAFGAGTHDFFAPVHTSSSGDLRVR